MNKCLIIGLLALGFTQSAYADKSEVLSCINHETMQFIGNCTEKIIEKHTFNNNFFTQLADKKITTENDAMATITYYPEKQLIVVKSLEEQHKPLLASVKY